MAIPTYEIFIDWDNDSGLDVGNFEVDEDDWVSNGAPTVATSTTRAHLGSQSLLITWTGAAGQAVSKTMTGLISGRSYTFSAWVFVGSGDRSVRLVMGSTTGSASTTTNAWEKITVARTAAAAEETIKIEPSSTPTAGDVVYMDQVMVYGTGEDVTSRVLARDGMEFSYGRDTARSLAEFQPGEATLLIDNDSRDYSPDNTGSPLYGYVVPGRNIVARATYNDKSYTLFNGFIDDYVLIPGRADRSLQITALDVLQKLNEATISTALYRSIQTGEAIHKVLDAVSWPTNRRIIDAGATTIPWWWEEGNDAFDALDKIVKSEGPPSIAYTDAHGNFVFKGRHHRILEAASTTVQAAFTSGDGPIEEVGLGTVYTDTASGTAFTLNKPTGVKHGDTMIAIAANEVNATCSEPTGWTEVRTVSLDSGTDDVVLSIMVKDVEHDDPASWAGSFSVASTRRFARVWALRGTAPAADLFVAENGNTDAADTPLSRTTPSVTNTASGAWRMSVFLAHENETGQSWGSYSPADTELFDTEIGTVDPVLNIAAACSKAPVSTNDSKSVTATISGTTAIDTSATWIGLIRPYQGEGIRFEEEGFEYDIGWKDIVNSVEIPIEEREPTFLQTVFETEDTIVIPASSTHEIIMDSEELFYNAITPEEDTDYVVTDGEVTVSLSRDSGETATIFIQSGVNTAVVQSLKVRAVPVPVAREVVVKVEDTSSIANHGVHSLDEVDIPWANVHDAKAVAETILGLRAERLPLITFRVTNTNDEKTTQILSRDLSDRIHVVEHETFTDHDFFIERIDMSIEEAGQNHYATFGCERAPTQVENVFTFGVAGKGFDQGVLGQAGIDSADTVMILGQGTLDNKVLGT